MINPAYYLNHLRAGIESDYKQSRERALVMTKLDEAELWLARCAPTVEALARDQTVASEAAHRCLMTGMDCDRPYRGLTACEGECQPLPTGGDDTRPTTIEGTAP